MREACASMPMTVVYVGYVWMLMLERLVLVEVRVRLSLWIMRIVRVPVMLVMMMHVLVQEGLMNVDVAVALAQE